MARERVIFIVAMIYIMLFGVARIQINIDSCGGNDQSKPTESMQSEESISTKLMTFYNFHLSI